jgi:acyl carrier protein
MSPEPAELHALVAASLADLRKDLALPELPEITPQTAILGGGSDLDSMAVVHLITELEGRLEERYRRNWILADERALSRRRSPFRTVGDLCTFIVETTPEA